MIQVVVVDDERLAVDELTFLLSEIPDVRVVGAFTNAEKALAYVFETPPDLLFLDINMPALNGMVFAEAIKGAKLKTKVVFATAYDAYAVSAFEKNAFDYILKPYETARIHKIFDKFRFNLESAPQQIQKLSIWKGEKVVFVDFSDILYCEVCNNQTLVCTKTHCYEVPQTLTALEQLLSQDCFLRTHRNFLINTEKVLEASPYFNQTMVVRLKGSDKEIPISRSYVKAFKQVMHIL